MKLYRVYFADEDGNDIFLCEICKSYISAEFFVKYAKTDCLNKPILCDDGEQRIVANALYKEIDE